MMPVHKTLMTMQFQTVWTTAIHQKGLKWSVCTVYCLIWIVWLNWQNWSHNIFSCSNCVCMYVQITLQLRKSKTLWRYDTLYQILLWLLRVLGESSCLHCNARALPQNKAHTLIHHDVPCTKATCILDHLWTDYSKNLSWQPPRSTEEWSWIRWHHHHRASMFAILAIF